MVGGHAIRITGIDRLALKITGIEMGMKEDRPMINRRIRRKDLEVVLSTGPCGDQIRIHESISALSVVIKSENMLFIRLVTDVCMSTNS